jgi:peptidoglycan/xylan/chitin deacetylase (PgdA/CDA1 family)
LLRRHKIVLAAGAIILAALFLFLALHMLERQDLTGHDTDAGTSAQIPVAQSSPELPGAGPDLGSSYIRVVQMDLQGNYRQAYQVEKGHLLYIDVMLINSGDASSNDVTVSLEGLYGLEPFEERGVVGLPAGLERSKDSLFWKADNMEPGARRLYRFSFDVSGLDEQDILIPYITLSSPVPREALGAKEAKEALFEASVIISRHGIARPGDVLKAEVVLSNYSKEPFQNINVILELPEGLVRAEGPLFWKIDEIGPDQSLHLGTDVAVSSELYSESNVKCRLRVSSIFMPKDKVFDSNQLIISGPKPFEGGTVPIIALHGIEPQAEGRYEISTEAFDYMLRLLKTHGYETVSLKDLYEYHQYGKDLPERPVIITSDDGYESIYTHAYPMLLKYDYSMSLFVSTAYIGADSGERMLNEFDFEYEDIPKRGMLIWPEIIEMAAGGMEIGSHGVYHRHYGDLPFEDVSRWLKESKEEIGKNIKKDCLFFAWPHDSVHEEALALLEDWGYLGALRYKGGAEDTKSLDLFSIKRINIESPIPVEAYAGLFMVE